MLQEGNKCALCESRYYFDEENKECKSCSILCESCLGNTEFDCISCREGYYIS